MKSNLKRRKEMEILSTIGNWAATTGVKIIIALVILLVSFRLIKVAAQKLEKSLNGAQKLDETLTKTLIYVAKVALEVVVVICLVGYLGIDTSGLAALVASLGVCVGLAVNGTLSNLAGGALILITRPFKIGDYISAQGYEGTVEDIHIISTKIITVDNKVIYLPNGSLSSGSIVNFSEKELRRVDHEFSVAGNDLNKVRSLISDVCAANEKILADPAPFVRVCEYGAGNGTKVVVRAWTKGADYWDVYFALLDDVNKAFEANGIVIPFNQLDVHVKNN